MCSDRLVEKGGPSFASVGVLPTLQEIQEILPKIKKGQNYKVTKSCDLIERMRNLIRDMGNFITKD